MFERICILRYYIYYKYWLRFSNRVKLEQWQQKKLKQHFRFVAKNSVLYKKKQYIENYPKIDKDFMMKNFDKLNTVNISRKEAEQFAVKAERERNFVPKLRGITIGLSSGTSGRKDALGRLHFSKVFTRKYFKFLFHRFFYESRQ